MEQPLVAGRGFDSRDLKEDAGTIIVNTTFAQRAFGSTNAIGRRVRQVASDGAPVAPWLDIVGVVGHMGVHALTPSQDEGVYFPLAEGDANPVRLAIWVRGDPMVLAPRVHELARAVDPNAVITMPIPLDQMFEGDWYLLRVFVLGAALLVGVLLSLAASALYAILTLVVSQRTREIGIRVALGASRWGIARHIATRAFVQIGAGVLLGLPFAGALCYEFLEAHRLRPLRSRRHGDGIGARRIGHAAGVTRRVHRADAARVEDRADGRAPCGTIVTRLAWRNAGRRLRR